MKRQLFTIVLAVFSLMQIHAANDVLRIVHNGITDYAPLSDIDSIYFDDKGGTIFIQPIEKVAPIGISRTNIYSMDYIPAANCPSKISVVFNGSTVSAENPFFLSGVCIAADGAYVTVNNTNTKTEYTTDLSGSTTDGGFTYKGDYKTTIELNGVSITSQRGAAIDIQCGKRVALELKKGTVSNLVDAAGGKQKAALYCKGHLEIDKSGTLNVTGNTAHAISAKEYIQLKKSTGIINILGAKNDGIHCKQYFYAKGFTVNYLGGSPSNYNTTNYYTLCNTSGEAICTFKFEGNVSNSLSLLTAPNLGKGTITVKQGTAEPTSCASGVDNANGKCVFFISPTVTTTGTAATCSSK